MRFKLIADVLSQYYFLNPLPKYLIMTNFEISGKGSKVRITKISRNGKTIMKLLWLSWEEVEYPCELLARQIKRSKFKPEVLVGISRGGFPVARILCDELELRRLASLQIEYYSAPGQTGKRPRLIYPLNADVKGKKVLLVDDVADRGDSLKLAKEHVLKRGAKKVKLATIHYKPWSKVVPDFYVRKVKAWIVYPWERKETIKQLKKMSL